MVRAPARPTTWSTTRTCAPARSTFHSANEENGHEEERVAEQHVSFSADRRENQGARRLAGQEAPPAPCPGEGGRSPRPRGGGEEGRSGGVPPRTGLHGRDVQERREDDLRQGRGPERSFAALQLQSRGEHEARHRLPRG